MRADRNVHLKLARTSPVRLCKHGELSPMVVWHLPPTLGCQLAELRRALAERDDEPPLAPVEGCDKCQGFTLGSKSHPVEH